jgi:hypothetical protein
MPSRRDLLQFTGAGYANGLLGNLTSYLPPVLITSVLGPAANAVFFVPWLIGTVIYGLLWNIASSFVVEATSDAERTGTHLRHATRLVLLVCIGATVTLVAGAPWLLELLGKDYSTGGATALRLIGLSVPFGCVSLTYTVSLLMQRRNWAIFRLSLVSSAISLPLFVLGTYHFGINGAVGGFLVADVVVAVFLLPTVVRRYRALANRSIDDDETMVIDMDQLRAELRNEDELAGGPSGLGGMSTPGANDETAVLIMSTLHAELQEHRRGAFTSNVGPWLRANDPTVVLDVSEVRAAEADEDTTVVMPRVRFDAEPAPRADLPADATAGPDPTLDSGGDVRR